MIAKKPKGATEKRQKSSNISSFLWMLIGAILTLMIGVFLYLSPIFNFSPAGEESSADADRQVKPKVETDKDNGDYEFYDVLPNQEMATIPDESVVIEDDNTVPDTFEPDVVVTQPRPRPEDEGNFGITEQTTVTPSASDQNADNNQIVIVEENETYDGTPAQPAAPANNPATTTGSAATPTAQSQPPTKKTYILQINSFGNADEADRRRAQVLMAGVDAKVVKKTTGSGQPLYQVISRPMSNRQAVVSAQQRLQNNGIDSLIVEQRQ